MGVLVLFYLYLEMYCCKISAKTMLHSDSYEFSCILCDIEAGGLNFSFLYHIYQFLIMNGSYTVYHDLKLFCKYIKYRHKIIPIFLNSLNFGLIPDKIGKVNIYMKKP
jgi:hypothetical protein